MDKLRPFSVENSSITCKKGKLTRRKGFVPLDLKLNFYLRVWCRTDIDRQKGKLRRANGKKKKSSQGENKEAKKSLTGHLGEILYRKVSALVSTSPPHPLLVTGPLPFLCCSNSDWFTVRKAAIDEVSASLTNYFHQFPFVLTWGTFLNSSFLPSSEGWKPFWRNTIAKSANQEGIRVTASPLIKTTYSFPSQWDCCLKSITPYTAQSARLLSAFLLSWSKITPGQKGLRAISAKKQRNWKDYADRAVCRSRSLLPLQNICECYLLNFLNKKHRKYVPK